MLALAQYAALRQNTEIVLDDKMIVDLAVGEDSTARAQIVSGCSARIPGAVLSHLLALRVIR
ncbi:MAG: hypothetical protein ACRDTJ_09315 [Pseudonocardiaceae bacterium]